MGKPSDAAISRKINECEFRRFRSPLMADCYARRRHPLKTLVFFDLPGMPVKRPEFFLKLNRAHRNFVTCGPYFARIQIPTEVRPMRKLPIAVALVVLSMSAPAFAQEADLAEPAAKPARVSVLRAAISEVAILRYRAALKLKADQEKYWPAVASALRALSREPQVTEAAVRRFAPQVQPLLNTLDDHQRQVAIGIAQKAGLMQYAALF